MPIHTFSQEGPEGSILYGAVPDLTLGRLDIHIGYNLAHRYMPPLAEAFAARGLATLVIDTIGSGVTDPITPAVDLTEDGPAIDLTTDRRITVATELLDEADARLKDSGHNHKTVYRIGHCAGSIIACGLTLRRPVDKLVLVEPMGIAPVGDRPIRDLMQRGKLYSEIRRRLAAEQAAEARGEPYVLTPGKTALPDHVDRLRAADIIDTRNLDRENSGDGEATTGTELTRAMTSPVLEAARLVTAMHTDVVIVTEPHDLFERADKIEPVVQAARIENLSYLPWNEFPDDDQPYGPMYGHGRFLVEAGTSARLLSRLLSEA